MISYDLIFFVYTSHYILIENTQSRSSVKNIITVPAHICVPHYYYYRRQELRYTRSRTKVVRLLFVSKGRYTRGHMCPTHVSDKCFQWKHFFRVEGHKPVNHFGRRDQERKKRRS